MNRLIVEFEKQKVVKGFMEGLDVYYTNLGGYHYSKDRSPCYYLNGMLTMFEEQEKKIDEVNEKHSEEKRILHNVIEMNQAKIDELQKRIDDASNKIDFWVGGKNGDAIHVAKSIGNILKGNKDEN